MKDIDVKFSESVEIMHVMSTIKKNWLHIYCVDHENLIVMIILWDFENNLEQSIM